MSKRRLDLNRENLICLCEGNAEYDILTLLLEHEKLIFTREMLHSNKLFKRMTASKVSENFLQYAYKEKPLILNFADSKSESFKLKKPYNDMADVIKVCTSPEVEILIIIDKNDISEFNKCKSNIKPSIFCKQNYKMKNIKTKGFMTDYFCDISKLVKAIEKYNSKISNNEYCIYDLLKD